MFPKIVCQPTFRSHAVFVLYSPRWWWSPWQLALAIAEAETTVTIIFTHSGFTAQLVVICVHGDTVIARTRRLCPNNLTTEPVPTVWCPTQLHKICSATGTVFGVRYVWEHCRVRWKNRWLARYNEVIAPPASGDLQKELASIIDISKILRNFAVFNTLICSVPSLLRMHIV